MDCPKGGTFMLYIGHFAFARDGNHHGYGPSHGYFTTVIEAPDIETALDKFKTLLHKLREDEDLFDDVNAVFLDACIECHTIPPTGFCVWQDQNEENGHVRMRTIRGMHGDARRAR